MAFKWAALSDFFNYTILPYINGISQPLTRLLEKHDIRVVNKPLKTLQQEFPSPKSPTSDLISNLTWFTKYLVLTAHGGRRDCQML